MCIEDIKRALIWKLKKKYKNDEEVLISLLEDSRVNNNKLYGDCLVNCLLLLLKDNNDRQTVNLFINDLLRSLE